MPVLRRLALVAMVWVGSSCRSPDMSSTYKENTPVGCTFGERRAAACAALENAMLMDAAGTSIPATVVHCELGELTGAVQWELAAEPPVPFGTMVRFGANGPRDALRPVSVDPLVLEWPTRVPQRLPVRLRALVARGCAVDHAGSRMVEVDIAPFGPQACEAAARLTGGDPTWCKRPMAVEEEYAIREYEPFARRLRHSATVQLGAGARMIFDGSPMYARSDAQVRSLLDLLWEAAPQIVESCRDGRLQVVEARRPDRWKVVLRSCRSSINLSELLELFRPG